MESLIPGGSVYLGGVSFDAFVVYIHLSLPIVLF